MIVMKFGGTSVESAEAIARVAGIARARLARKPVVVVSAMGKTTNKLLAIANLAVTGDRDEALELLAGLRAAHLKESPASVHASVENLFDELEELIKGVAVMGELTPRTIDAVSAYGERLSSEIVTAAFNELGIPAVHVDSRDVIVTDTRHTQAAPLVNQSYAKLQATIPALAESKVVVMGGFIAATEDGVTSTLGRGGSDFTASLVGAGIDAEEIQIWTDVDGMLTADPTVMPGGFRVRTISFGEAAELAYFGAKVLHPSTVLPAVDKNIPVLILNSRRPEVEGTRIVRDAVPCTSVAKSIACKKKITLLNITSTRMLGAHGFLRQIFEIFDKYETPVDMVATTEVSVSLTIDSPANLKAIVRDLRQFAEVSAEDDQAIVCIVGDNIRHTPGVASRAFTALRDINIRMISQGASLLNLSVVVAQSDLGSAVERLHAEFFSNPDQAVRSMKIAIVGYGKMGRLIDQLAPEYDCEVALIVDDSESIVREKFEGIDVAIEFSTPQTVVGNIERLAAIGVSAVVGTTGWHDQLEHVTGVVNAAGTGLVWSPNFSVGVNVFFRLVAEASRLLAGETGYGAWAWEIHHDAKLDAPSGTLVKLVELMKEHKVSVSSNRAGMHPGTHEIGFDSAADTITLRHTARNREGFARGALSAGRWIEGKKGVFKFLEEL